MYPAASSDTSQAVYPRVGGGTTLASDLHAARLLERSIPAWAGEPIVYESAVMPLRVCWVYPRVGGGTFAAWFRAGLTR